MALFGDLGKALGFGTAKETLAAATQGAIRGAIMGQPFMGAAGGAIGSGGRRQEAGQSVAVSIAQEPPRESAFSSQAATPVMQATPISYSPGIQPRS